MSLRYFLSGASGIRAEVVPDVAALIECRLLSMHHAFKGNTKVWCEVSHHPRSAMREVMLDSGAFTAFTKGEKVTLDYLVATYDDVMARISKSVKHIWLINLDVIPGEMGRDSTDREIADALDQSDRNFRVLKKRYGDRVLPVFHQTEPDARMAEVFRMNGFVAGGFRQDLSEEYRIRFAKRFVHEAHRKGREVHGLATTGYKMLRAVPFDTVDSATWLYIAAMGGIHYVDESGLLSSLAVSDRSPSQRDLRQHYNSSPEGTKRVIDARMAAAGVTLEQIQTDLSYRILLNAHEMREWLTHHYTKPAIKLLDGDLFA